MLVVRILRKPSNFSVGEVLRIGLSLGSAVGPEILNLPDKVLDSCENWGPEQMVRDYQDLGLVCHWGSASSSAWCQG